MFCVWLKYLHLLKIVMRLSQLLPDDFGVVNVLWALETFENEKAVFLLLGDAERVPHHILAMSLFGQVIVRFDLGHKIDLVGIRFCHWSWVLTITVKFGYHRRIQIRRGLCIKVGYFRIHWLSLELF